MRLSVKKWGNSLAIRLPVDIARPLDLEEGSVLELEVANGMLMFSPENRKRTLAELLQGVTPETVHPEVDWGGALGSEIW
ncbi:MAG: AbrB/MazE/SpoVT family DNA-binding domain-containing protein [Trueperaceae bacterium]